MNAKLVFCHQNLFRTYFVLSSKPFSLLGKVFQISGITLPRNAHPRKTLVNPNEEELREGSRRLELGIKIEDFQFIKRAWGSVVAFRVNYNGLF